MEEGMATTAPKTPKHQATVEDLTLEVRQEIHVKASLDKTFDALLLELGPENVTPDGVRMGLTIEPWPGGRWYRDLGNDNGHCWGQVQAIKRPVLLEFYGPLFMSYPVANNVQYRLKEQDGGTLIEFRHTAIGLITDEHRAGVVKGWSHIHESVRQLAESSGKKAN
jgi:uncharacterized protein YndB with AHSA1/START domain